MFDQSLSFTLHVIVGTELVAAPLNHKWRLVLQGDYVRRWVPELSSIGGADVHTPWTLSSAALSHAHVALGETYPTPVVVASEWSRHFNKKPVSVSEKGSGYYE